MSKSRSTKPAAKKEKPSKVFSDTASSTQPEMKTSEIRDLIDFISKTGLNEVNIETSELKLHVKREPDQKVFKSTPVMAPMSAPAALHLFNPQPSHKLPLRKRQKFPERKQWISNHR
jgi:acetyl-CoA carboxylase biotin carboxyl carrier protein